MKEHGEGSDFSNDNSVSDVRMHRPYTISKDDLDKVRSFDTSTCPRRYCWWWTSLKFEWNLSAAEGCTFMDAEKPEGWNNADCECRRTGADSNVDQYEPRDAQILEDKVDSSLWDA
jgi:hypothetical protein